MAKGFTSAGVDFDDLFDPDVVGDGPAAAWLTSGGVALKYAALAYGTKRANVGFKSAGGVDVSNLWAAKGTAVYLTGVSSNQVTTTGVAISASITVRAYNDGAILFFADDGGAVNYYFPTTAGIGTQYQIRVSGPVSGSRNMGGAATLTGKGGVNFAAAIVPGNSGAYDTGWQEMDDAADILSMLCSSGAVAGESTVSGTMNIDVRLKSTGVVARSFSILFSCTSDSQS